MGEPESNSQFSADFRWLSQIFAAPRNYIGQGQKGTPGRGRDRKCHDRASLSRPLVFFFGPLTSLASSPLFCTSEDIHGRGGGGPLTKWGWRERGPICHDIFWRFSSRRLFGVPFWPSPMTVFRRHRFSQKTAGTPEFRRKPQETAEFCSNPFVTFRLSL